MYKTHIYIYIYIYKTYVCIYKHTFLYVHVCIHMISYMYACLHVHPHLHRYPNIFQTITHMAQSLTLISNLLRSWDLCPQQRPQSWPCLQWWGSQAVTLWSRHKSGLQCNLPIRRILSAAGNFCTLFSVLDCPHGTEVFTGTATLAKGLKAFTEEAPALISAYLHMACSWWHCELRRWFGWSWLLSFLLKASTSRCPRISQEIWEIWEHFANSATSVLHHFTTESSSNLLSWVDSKDWFGRSHRLECDSSSWRNDELHLEFGAPWVV